MYITNLFTLLLTALLTAATIPPASKIYKGDMTYFTPGLGSCGTTNNANQFVVSLSPGVMMNGANPNDNPKCQKYVTITYKGKTAQGKIVDTCTSCAYSDINVSPVVFKKFAPLSDGRLHNVTWHFNT